MTGARDAEALSDAARLAEIGEILGRGWLRTGLAEKSQLSAKSPLAEQGETERGCGRPIQEAVA